MITFERIAALPVPTHTWFGLDGATSIEPIEPVVDLPVADRHPRDAGVLRGGFEDLALRFKEGANHLS